MYVFLLIELFSSYLSQSAAFVLNELAKVYVLLGLREWPSLFPDFFSNVHTWIQVC